MVMIEWDDRFELGVARMDASHQEFIRLLARLGSAAEQEFPDMFARLLEHTEEHFAAEERWMLESGFPPIMVHRQEHEYVLQLLRESLDRIQAGSGASGRTLVKELLAWFEQHAASMDMALARHIEATGYRAA